MTFDQFWTTIERACGSDSRSSDDWYRRLVAELSQLSAIYSAAHAAWMLVTGMPPTAPYPVRSEPTVLVGEKWDIGDAELVRRRLPRLWSFYDDD